MRIAKWTERWGFPALTAAGSRLPGGFLWWGISLPVLLAAYMVTVWYLDRYFLDLEWKAYLSSWRLLMNGLPGILCIFLLAALCRRVILSTVVVTALHVLLIYSSKLKLMTLREPLAFYDLYFLTNIDRSSLGLFSSYIEHGGRVAALSALALLVLGGLWWLERPSHRAKPGPFLAVRVLVVLVTMPLLWSFCTGGKPWSGIYSAQSVRPVAWDPKMAVLRSGLVSSLAQQVVANNEFKLTSDPDLLEYMEHATEAAGTAGIGPAPIARDELPNVVLILSESFMDPTVMAGMAEADDAIPEVRRLLQAGEGGMMRVPTYGGGTVKTEFEVLTGMPLDAFPGINFPYFTLAGRKRLPALPAIFRDYGYRAIAVHGNSPAFWSRSAIFRTMGFQDFLSLSEFKEHGLKDGSWYSDASMTDIVLREISKESGPAFVFAISMENHGPYSREQKVRDRVRWQSVELPATVVSEGARLELRNYLYHLGNADRQLARLVSELGKESRPYVVVFFGDHLPAFNNVYEEVGFVDGQGPARQQVPWVVVRDPRLPYRELSMVTESWQLPVTLFDAVGLDGGKYLRLSREAIRLNREESDGEMAKKLLDGLHSVANLHLERGLEDE